MYSIDLKGKVVLVTGSSRGIGRAIAEEFGEAGADVAVHYRNSRAEAEEVASLIKDTGRRSLIVRGDVRRSEDVNQVIDSVREKFGRVDILVNNAGYALGGLFMNLSEDSWQDQMDTLAGGYFRFIKCVLPDMKKRNHGVILNIASTCGYRGSPGETAYAAANGAIIALTRSLALEIGFDGIRINALMVAWADNAFDPGNPEHTAYLPQFALRRVTTVSEIAKSAVYLCSDASSGITGATLPVDAGFLCC